MSHPTIDEEAVEMIVAIMACKKTIDVQKLMAQAVVGLVVDVRALRMGEGMSAQQATFAGQPWQEVFAMAERLKEIREDLGERADQMTMATFGEVVRAVTLLGERLRELATPDPETPQVRV